MHEVLPPLLFWTIAVVTGFSAVAVVVTQNIVRAATWLLFTLAGVSGVFFLLGAEFVAATQLFVYVGGTLVLVVFGVMLTAQGPFISMQTGAAEWALSLLVGLLLFGAIAGSVVLRVWAPPPDRPQMADSVRLGESLLGVTQATPEARLTGLDNPPRPMPGRTPVAYLLPFEIVSVHLLVVLIGAAYLARARRRRGEVP